MPKTGIRSYETKTKGRRWLAYYRKDGRQVNKRGFRTSRQAEQWRADQLINGSSPADSRITVGEWVTEWLERHRSQIKASTYERYRDALRLWAIPHIGMIRLTTLTHRDIESMHEAALRAGRSPATIRINHAPLREALTDAVREGLLPNNPASLVKLPRHEKPEIRPFDRAELAAFLSANHNHKYYAVYLLALHSGLRLGEITALRAGRDIDILERSVTVRETRRKGVITPPKSKSSLRRVVLGVEAAVVLAQTIAGRSWGALAFPYTPKEISRSMLAACRRAGVPHRRFHDLRHTHATYLLADGANIKAVSARLGHANIRITLDVYGHVLPGMDEDLAEASDRVFGPDATKTLS